MLTAGALAGSHARLKALDLVVVLAQHFHFVNSLLDLSMLLPPFLLCLLLNRLRDGNDIRDSLVLQKHATDFIFVRQEVDLLVLVVLLARERSRLGRVFMKERREERLSQHEAEVSVHGLLKNDARVAVLVEQLALVLHH